MENKRTSRKRLTASKKRDMTCKREGCKNHSMHGGYCSQHGGRRRRRTASKRRKSLKKKNRKTQRKRLMKRQGGNDDLIRAREQYCGKLLEYEASKDGHGARKKSPDAIPSFQPEHKVSLENCKNKNYSERNMTF